MKKTICILIMFLVLLSGSVFATEVSIQEKIDRCTYISPEKGNEITFTDDDITDWRKESKKREKAFEKVPEIWLEKYKSEKVSENERIKEYLFTGYSNHQIIDGKLKASISANIIPYSENSIWNDFSGQIYAEFGIDDNREYVLEKASIYPENYDKFVERFEEYQKRGETNTIETSKIQTENQELNNSQIEKTSNIICVLSLVVFVFIITIIVIRKVKSKKKKKDIKSV